MGRRFTASRKVIQSVLTTWLMIGMAIGVLFALACPVILILIAVYYVFW